jgi:dTDP-4-dehydrorhamnose reductase
MYGHTKAMGELLAMGSRADHLIIRTAWLYGDTGPNFVLSMLELARKTPVIRGVTDQVGAPTYTKDLVAGTFQLIEAGKRGIFHLTNSGQASKFEFVKEIVQLADIEVKVEEALSADFPTAAKRPAYSVLSLKGTLPYYQPRPWQEALAEYIRAT